MELPIQTRHQTDVDKNEDNKNIDRPLLGEPEAEAKSTQADLVELRHEKDAASKRDHEPDGQQNRKILEVFLPVGFFRIFFHLIYFRTIKVKILPVLQDGAGEATHAPFFFNQTEVMELLVAA